MKKILAGLCLLFAVSAYADSQKTFEDTLNFLEWLESHAKDFGHCKVDATEKTYRLCDGTELDKAEVNAFLHLSPKELIAKLKERNFKVDVLCEKETPKPAPFHEQCSPTLDQKMFSSISSLHGEYLPAERRILLREGSSVGTLVHEYLHSKQAENQTKIYGRVYKKERLELQANLARIMDEKIAEVKKIEKGPDKAAMKPLLKEFMIASELTRNMARWQDFIDERSLFLLYLRYAGELGVAKEDVELARKNIAFVCKNPELKKHVTEDQCAL